MDFRSLVDESTYKIHTELVSNDNIIDVIGATKNYAEFLECDISANLFRILKIASYTNDRHATHNVHVRNQQSQSDCSSGKIGHAKLLA